MGYYSKIKDLFKGETNNTSLQLFRYIFVGGSAFLVDFSIFFILTKYFHIHYLLSAGIGFIFGLMVNYILSIKWIFYNRAVEKRLLEFLFFALIGIIGLGLNELFIWIFTDLLLIYFLLSKLITAFIVYFWNFFARKFLLFNKSNHK